MPQDLYHYFGNDLQPGNTGDLLPIDGTVRGQQRILRRLLTNPGDYLWQPDYGAGLPAYIGQAVDTGKIVALIRSQIALEACVAPLPLPEITVAQLSTETSGFTVNIRYNDAQTKTPQILSFNVTR
jgi:phage baseplate assembly protein W